MQWKDHIPNEDLWNRSERLPIGTHIRRRNWRWVGHTCTLRKPKTSIVHQFLKWNLQEQRKEEYQETHGGD